MSNLGSEKVLEIRENARNAANAVLETYWPSLSIPVDPVQIARSMGLSVFRSKLDGDVWGMIIGDEGGSADIYLEYNQSSTRLRFSCAHELGHYVEHQSRLEPSTGFVDKRSESGKGSPDEIYANEFAGALLLPESVLVDHFNLGFNDFDIARRFAVSPASVKYRLDLLGLKCNDT